MEHRIQKQSERRQNEKALRERERPKVLTPPKPQCDQFVPKAGKKPEPRRP